MLDEILTSMDGAVGIIKLNRPKAINALNRNMIDLVSAAISMWLVDDAVKAILIEGEGERGFCAGGDVREIRTLVLDGRADEADDFFAREYALNEMISLSAKPIIALTHGIVMGGGIGLAGHAAIRVAASTCKFAMPESAIGLTCDVGANALLLEAPEAAAYQFLLSGTPVDAVKAKALNLTDYVISPQHMVQVRDILLNAANSGQLENVNRQLKQYCIHQSEEVFDTYAETLGVCFEQKNALDILSTLKQLSEESHAVQQLYETLITRCPTSLEVVLQNFRAAKRAKNIHAILENDKKLVAWLIRRKDFVEGVRAVLIDKTALCEWAPHKVGEVEVDKIKSLILRK